MLERKLELLRQRQQASLKKQACQETEEEQQNENEMLMKEMKNLRNEICAVQDDIARMEGTSMEPTPDS